MCEREREIGCCFSAVVASLRLLLCSVGRTVTAGWANSRPVEFVKNSEAATRLVRREPAGPRRHPRQTREPGYIVVSDFGGFAC